jgi:NhaA family Na+:H+ antiporter
MKTHTIPQHGLIVPVGRGASLSAVLTFLTDRFLWLPIGAALAVLWANVDGERYFTFSHRAAFVVNQIGMAWFVGLIAHEALEALAPGGALRHWRAWAMTLAIAAGGLLGTVFVYLTYVSLKGEEVLAQAWPVAAAVDVAAGYYVLRLIFRRGAPFAFFLLIALATNAVGLAVIALWPAFTVDHVPGALLVMAAVAIAASLRFAGVRQMWPYLLGAGAVSWCGFRVAGVHPALALVPIVPFLRHTRHPLAPFAERPVDGAGEPEERRWVIGVQVVLFFFGLVNAGVVVRGYDTGTYAILAAALVGRPVGMLAMAALAGAAGLHLPRSIGWRELTVVALATSSGFTFALFTAASLLPVGGVLTQVRVGALATALGAVVAYGAARWLHVGRFAKPR